MAGRAFWLDPGELQKIRDLFEDSEAKSAAADAYFAGLFNSPEIKAMKDESEEKLAKAQKMAGMLRFICPSQYVPGEQTWGAF